MSGRRSGEMMPGLTEEEEDEDALEDGEEEVIDEDDEGDDDDDGKWEEVDDQFGAELPSPLSEMGMAASISSTIPVKELPGDEDASVGAQQPETQLEQLDTLAEGDKGVSNVTLPLTEEVLAQKNARDAETAVVEKEQQHHEVEAR